MDNSAYTYRAVREAEAPSFLAGVKILTRRKYFFALLLVFSWAVAISYHKHFPKYVSASEVFVRSSANSLVTSLGGNMDGKGAAFGPEKNNLEKYLNYFGTYQYATHLANELIKFTSSPPPNATPADIEVGDPAKLLSPEMHAVLTDYLNNAILTQSSQQMVEASQKNKNSNQAKLTIVAEALQGAIDVYESKRDTIQTRVVAPDKNVSYHLSNFILATISRSIVSYDTQELIDTKNYLENNINDLSEDLGNIQKDFLKFIEDSAKGNPSFNPQGARDNTMLLKAMEDSILELKENNMMIAKIREQNINNIGQYTPHFVNILKQNSEALRIRRNRLILLGVSQDSKQITTIDEQIKSTDEKLKAAENQWKSVDTSPPTQDSSLDQTFSRTISTLQSINRTLNARISSVREMLKDSAGDTAKSTQEKQRMEEFTRKIGFNYILAENLQKKLLDIEIQKVSLNSKVRVIESANLQKTKHKVAATGKVLIATVLAILFGIFFSYASELFDTTIKSRHDLIDIGLNVFGTLPAQNGKKSKKSMASASISGLTENHETIEEMALKQIRSRIIRLKRRDKKDVQIFSVLSSIPGEGKSYFATNIARVLAQLGQPTLFIDCDVRRPSAPRTLGFENKTGIAQILTAGVPWRSTIQHIDHLNLDVISSGAMNDHISEAFASEKLRDLLQELKTQYRYIIIDCPPVLPVADGLSIASHTDTNFLVCSMHLSNKGEVAESLMRLSSQSTEPIQGILNRVVDHNRAKYSHMYLARSQEQVQKLESMKNAMSGQTSGTNDLSPPPAASSQSGNAAPSSYKPQNSIRIYPRKNSAKQGGTRVSVFSENGAPSTKAETPTTVPTPPVFNKGPSTTPTPPPFKGDLKKHA